MFFFPSCSGRTGETVWTENAGPTSTWTWSRRWSTASSTSCLWRWTRWSETIILTLYTVWDPEFSEETLTSWMIFTCSHQIEDERKKDFKIRRAYYDKKVSDLCSDSSSSSSSCFSLSSNSKCRFLQFILLGPPSSWLYFYLQIVILKELKHSDGNFDETEKIELNAVRSKHSSLFCQCSVDVRWI